MSGRGKRYRRAIEKVEPGRGYALDEAIATVQSFDPPKFDETIDLALRLGIDPKQGDQLVRGTFSMPKGIGKENRVVVFCGSDKADEAREAGAIEVGSDDLLKKVGDGWLDFDVAVATPEMMPKVGRLGRVLGPQGKMPSPKSGTVTEHVGNAVREFRAGKIEYRNDDSGNLHVPVGKRSFNKEDLAVNVSAFLDHVRSSIPSGVKGRFILKATLSGSMSPPVPLRAVDA